MLTILFCLFNAEADANRFFDYLNSQNPYIKFTIEKEVGQKLAFLDVLVDDSSSTVITRVFRKKNVHGSFDQFL